MQANTLESHSSITQLGISLMDRGSIKFGQEKCELYYLDYVISVGKAFCSLSK